MGACNTVSAGVCVCVYMSAVWLLNLKAHAGMLGSLPGNPVV